MSSKAEHYIDNLTAKGRIAFSLKMFCQELNINDSAATSSLSRLKQQRKIASVARGYYLILTPEYRAQGCLPTNFFIDELMNYLELDYYVGLLSAAMFYGAAHQQPQMLQVMLTTKKPNIHCGNTVIELIKNNQLLKTPIKTLPSKAGYMKISTPEATAMDMMKFSRQCGGIHRIATILEELAESMNANDLAKLAGGNKGAAWINRLGYLLDHLGFSHLADPLYDVFDKQSRFRLLSPSNSLQKKIIQKNKKWRININTTVSTDLDDSF